MVLLLLALSAAQPAAAQVPGQNLLLVTFYKDPAVYEESEAVVFKIDGSTTAVETVRRVRVFCESGCPENDRPVYDAPVSSPIWFPRDFCQLANNVRDCVNLPTPSVRLEPRWNGTWAVTLHDASGLEVYRTRFAVQLTDAWTRGYLLHPTDTLTATGGGFLPGSNVKMSFGRLNGAGQDVLFRNLTLKASAAGQAEGAWKIPKTEAVNVLCGTAICRRYFVQVSAEAGSGNTKTVERTWYKVEPAPIATNVVEGPNILTQANEFERTETVRFTFQATYPDGSFVLPTDFASGKPEVEIQRVDPSTGVPGIVEKRAPTYISAGLYQLDWTIPRSLELKGPTGVYEFRFVVQPGQDRYGNTHAAIESQPFNVKPAVLEARFSVAPEDLERAEPERWIVTTRYHDGQPFNDTVNQTWLMGHLYRRTPQGDMLVPDSEVRAKYVPDGHWAFDYKFERDYPFLGEHVFQLEGGRALANDTWDNYIATNASLFVLDKALPRVLLTEKAGDTLVNETTGWTRNTRVDITLQATYGDGSAYNSTRHFQQGVFNATLTKRRGEAEIVETVVVPFRISNEALGLWTASVPLTLVDRDTPIGRWTLRFDFLDDAEPANGGPVSFDRRVHPAEIRVQPQLLDRTAYLLGEEVSWRFTLTYPDGKPATDADIPVLLVDAYRWSGEKTLGIEAANLVAQWRPEKVWQIRWTPPNGARLGEFVLVPRGVDQFGNPLEKDRSDPFRVYVPTIDREILVQPPETVVRNETVYVMFDGLPGDAGDDETGCPRVAVQRWSRDRWVIEVEDVLGKCEPGKDHFASWTTSEATTLGVYRFAFAGRDAKRAYLNATSAPFTLLPLSATRAVVEQPQATVAKGDLARFTVSRLPSDSFQSAWVLRHGERLVRADIKSANLTTWFVTWRPDYRLAGGNYSLEITGRDKDGNALRIVSRAFTVSDVGLRCDPLEDVPSTARRGETVRFTFRCFLPDDTILGPVHGAPTVILEADGRPLATLTAQGILPNWIVEHKVPIDLALGSYSFRVTGADTAGNPFRTFVSGNFTIQPGAVVRKFETPPTAGARLTKFTAAARANRTDEPGLSCYAGYVGGAVTPQEAETAQPLTTLAVKWAPNPARGTYDISWDAPVDATLGWYRFDCEGKDTYGNSLTWRSPAFQVAVARINPSIAAKPTADQFQGGAAQVFRVRIAYSGQEPQLYTPESGGRLTAVFTLDGQRVEQEPDVTYDTATKTWVLTWQAPDVLPPGAYALIVSGADRHGNAIISLRVAEYDVQAEIGERLFGIPGFDRAVPGSEPLAGLVAAVAVAVLVLRRR